MRQAIINLEIRSYVILFRKGYIEKIKQSVIQVVPSNLFYIVKLESHTILSVQMYSSKHRLQGIYK